MEDTMSRKDLELLARNMGKLAKDSGDSKRRKRYVEEIMSARRGAMSYCKEHDLLNKKHRQAILRLTENDCYRRRPVFERLVEPVKDARDRSVFVQKTK
jgi:hypothetical protein